MEETYQVTSFLRYLPAGREIALVTDARFSGVSTGPCIGHVSPEALEGGPIGKVVDGDLVRIVVDPRDLEASVELVGHGDEAWTAEEAAAVLEERPTNPAVSPDQALPADTALWARLQSVSGGLWGGCVYDSSRSCTRSVRSPRPRPWSRRRLPRSASPVRSHRVQAEHELVASRHELQCDPRRVGDVAGLDRVDEVAVRDHAEVEAAEPSDGCVGRQFEVALEATADRLERLHQKAVAGNLRDPGVKGAVGVVVRGRRFHRLRETIDAPVEIRDVVARCALRGELDELQLEHLARLDELLGLPALERGLADRHIPAVDDERAARGFRLDQPGADEHADRLADRADADRERARELAVARQALARLEFAARYLPSELGGDRARKRLSWG